MLSIKALTKNYAGRKVLDSLTASFDCGKVNVVAGASGSGKTTLLRLIARLEKPDSGEIVGAAPDDIAFAFQEPRLFPWLTAEENVACVAAGGRDEAIYLSRTLLTMCGMGNDTEKKPSSLSGGMRMRVSLLRALASAREWLLLDEPFRALDDVKRSEMLALLDDRIAARGIFTSFRPASAVLVTHSQAVRSYYGGNTLVL